MPSSSPGSRALSLRLATAVVLVEAVAAWGYIGYLTADAAGDPGGWRVIGYFAIYAVAFAFLSWGLWRRRRWVRAPLIVLQLLLVVAGFSLVNGAAPVPGAVIIVLAIGCAGLLLAPTTYQSLT